MKDVVYNATTVVCIQIIGKGKDGMGKDMRTRRAQAAGLIKKFLLFCAKEMIFSEALGAGRCGGGEYVGFYTPENAERITAWIKEQEAAEKEA